MADPIRKPRRHPVPRQRNLATGKWIGQGRQVRDHVTDVEVPIKLTVKQRGGRVCAGYEGGSRDKPKWW